MILPWILLYFTALLRIFANICRKYIGLPTTCGHSISDTPLFSSSSPIFSAWDSRSVQQPLSTSRISNGLCSTSSLLVSNLFISSTSFTRCRRLPAVTFIFSWHSFNLSGSSQFFSSISSIPMMPLIGVRISWDIFRRNSALASLAILASFNALTSSC